MASENEIVEASRHSPGNAAALREAIEPWVAFGEWLLENAGKEGLGAAIREYGPIIRQRLEELRAVLAKPPRNCDVGTPEDQEKRYKLKREVYHTLTLTNALAWAQTPYEAQEGGAE